MDLVLDVVEWEGGLKGHIDYNTDLFQPETVSRMAGHLQVSHAADLGSVNEKHCEKHDDLCFFTAPALHHRVAEGRYCLPLCRYS